MCRNPSIFACSHHIDIGVILRTHPIRGETHSTQCQLRGCNNIPSCSLLNRRTVSGRAAGNKPRTQKQTRNCTNSIVALQDQYSYKAPTTNHYIKKKQKNIPSFSSRTAPIAHSFCEVCTWHDLHILVTAPFVAIRKPERHVRKASHCGSKQQ